jgi:hypothetical protein
MRMVGGSEQPQIQDIPLHRSNRVNRSERPSIRTVTPECLNAGTAGTSESRAEKTDFKEEFGIANGTDGISNGFLQSDFPESFPRLPRRYEPFV